MQVLFSPSSTPPIPTRASKASHPPRHISFKAGRTSRALTPTSEASLPSVGMVTAASRTNFSLGTIDLTKSPATSPCSSNTALSRSSSHSSAGSNSATPKAPRSRSPAISFPPPSFLGFHNVRSAPSLPAPPRTSAPIHSAPRSRAESPPLHKRAKFLLPGDGDSDRERDRDGDRESAHDDSDDSDRTSFFSAEEFVVPASALHGAGGRVLDAACAEGIGGIAEWQSQETPAPPKPAQEDDRDTEHDANHEIRRWHALMEVVHSEVGYVRDLRILVNVYLSLLPTLPLSSPAQEAVQELVQDAVDLLELHERFARALELTGAPVAGGESPRGSIDKAVKQLARVFIVEAPAFDLYQRFCSTQPDVMRLLRPAQARAEWALFERRCALGGQDAAEQEVPATEKEFPIQDANDVGPPEVPAPAPISTPGAKGPSPRAMSRMPSAFKSYALSTPSSQNAEPPHPPSHRRHSYDSLAGVFGAGSGSSRHRPNIIRPLSDSPAPSPPSQNSRLRFHDFLIKPVQRICKYPLMLEGLRSKVRGDPADAAVVAAVESMRGVATRVDEARRRRESAVKSKLIVERTEPHPVVTPDFMTSLGDCLLAGSLDVVHHHQTLNPISTPVRVKYLGGFLYLGGYLLLVKIGKGKTYRVKHWFSLAPFDIVDISQETALVPSSFRLSYMGHHFEIAVACQREKDLWLRAINEARNVSPPWNLEPISSLQILLTEPSMSPASDSDTGEPFMPIKRGASSPSVSDSVNPLTMLRLSSTRFRSSPSSSTPTVRYIFSHTEESSILLHRSSSGNRNFVDRGLSDVLSDLVSGLRKQALAHQEMLFPPPQLSDTSQTIAVAAKNKLMRRGSVLVARPRGQSAPDITGGVQVDTDRVEEAGPSSSTLRPKTMATYCRRMALIPALSMLYTEPESMKVEPGTSVDLRYSEPEQGGLPHTEITRSLTVATGRHTPQSTHSESRDPNPHYHRRARSLVGSVKGLMRFGSTRSTNSQEASEAWRALHHADDCSSDTGESTETGSKSGTGRRRVSSAPTSPPISSANSIFFPDSDQASSSTSTTPETPFPSPLLIEPPSSPATSKLFRKKSASIPLNHDQTLKPRRSLKSFVFYNRLTTVDPA